MKAIKTLLAVSVLAAAGAANAATIATFNSVALSATTDFTSTVGNGGFGVLDTTGGVTTLTLTFTSSDTALAPGFSANIANITDVFTGTLSGGTFTITGGTTAKAGPCTGAAAGVICNSAGNVLVFPTLDTFATASGTVSISGGGSITTTFTSTGTQPTLTTSHYTLGAGTPTPAVPVPAAAWLFGSGLLGLAGTARRRNAK
jgi:hypothetical protein